MKITKRIFVEMRNRDLLRWVPDKAYLSFYYKLINGVKPDLDLPRLFTEKLQWLKIHDHNPVYTVMADKYLAKEFVSERVGAQYVIPAMGVWETPEQIPFDDLPQKYVLKTTHDSGGIVIVDKSKGVDREKIKAFLQGHLDRDLYSRTREWPYKDIPHRIIAEAYLENSVEIIDGERREILLDYKFYCFNGEPKFLYVGYSNMKNGQKHDQLTFFDLNWEAPPFYRSDHEQLPFAVKKPAKLDEMIEICKALSKDVPFVRVDLYYVNDTIYFSELTFSPGSGFAQFEPLEWEKRIGDWITLPAE